MASKKRFAEEERLYNARAPQQTRPSRKPAVDDEGRVESDLPRRQTGQQQMMSDERPAPRMSDSVDMREQTRQPNQAIQRAVAETRPITRTSVPLSPHDDDEDEDEDMEDEGRPSPFQQSATQMGYASGPARDMQRDMQPRPTQPQEMQPRDMAPRGYVQVESGPREMQPRDYPAGMAPRRVDPEPEYEIMPQRDTMNVNSGPLANPGRPRYNDYFLPGDGIDREVIMSEICRFLGNDATVKPGRNDDNRSGFIIKAYRAPTSEMIRSIKEESAKYVRARENAQQRRQPTMTYNNYRDTQYPQDSMMMIDEPQQSQMYAAQRMPYDDPRPQMLPPQPQPRMQMPYASQEMGYGSQYAMAGPAQRMHQDVYTQDPRAMQYGNRTPPHQPVRQMQPVGYAPDPYQVGGQRMQPVNVMPAAGYAGPPGDEMRPQPYYPQNQGRRHG